MQVSKEVLERNSQQDLAAELHTLSDAGAGVIHIRTNEINRCLASLRLAITVDDAIYNEWDIINGWRKFDVQSRKNPDVVGDTKINLLQELKAPDEARKAAKAGASSDGPSPMQYFVFVQPQFWAENNPALTHWILHYVSELPATDIRIILVTPDMPMPENISGSLTTIRFSPPGHEELMKSLEGILKDLSEEIELTDEEKNEICFSGAGMSAENFEMYASVAIVDANNARQSDDDPLEVTSSDIVKGVNKGKTQIVNQNDLLELYPSEDIQDVGGLDLLKDWMEKRRVCFTEDAMEFGIEPPKGIVLVGPPGCMAGDTVVEYRRGRRNSSRELTLREFYYKFNGLAVPGASHGRATPWRDVTAPTYLHSIVQDDEGNDYVKYNRVLGVTEAGEKQLCEVGLSDGTVLRLTDSHPISTPSGFVPAGEIQIGDQVVMRGSMKPQKGDGRKRRQRGRAIVNLKYHPNGARKETDRYLYTRVNRAVLVVEATMNDMDYDEYVHALKHNSRLSRTFRYIPKGYVVHHIDEDCTNDSLDNLMILAKDEHDRLHTDETDFNVDYFSYAQVSYVRGSGTEMTYDVQMDAPGNNFAANGVFVHNTGKSLVAKAVAGVLSVPLIRLDFGKVFQSLVGSSEERIRTALQHVTYMAPCVLFVDEIDKGLGGIGGGGGDSGTSSRVLGTFLTWLNDCKAPVFTMVTANNISGLPPELMRKGRFDEIFATGFPDFEDRKEILKIHLRRRGWDISSIEEDNLNVLISKTNGRVGAEIEAGVKEGLIDAFYQEKVDIDTADDLVPFIVSAVEGTKSLAEAYSAQIGEMEAWAKQNARAAGYSRDEPKAEEKKAQVRSRVRQRARKSAATKTKSAALRRVK